jgi:hypothetical protein
VPHLGALLAGSAFLASPFIDLSSASCASVTTPQSLPHGPGRSDLGQGCFAAWARDCTKVNPPPVLGNGSVDHQHLPTTITRPNTAIKVFTAFSPQTGGETMLRFDAPDGAVRHPFRSDVSRPLPVPQAPLLPCLR